MKSTIKDEFYKFIKDQESGAANDGQKLIAALENQRQVWLQHRQSEHDAQWRQNVAFYAGKHYVRDNGKNSNQYRVRLRENHTNNVVNRMVSIFVQNMPITRVFPATDSYLDIQNAESCEAYMKYFWRTKQLEVKYAKLVKYACIFGNAFAFRQYDPHAGGMMQLSPDETGGKAENRQWRGDVRLDIDDPLKINVRPGIEEMEDMFDFFRSVPSNKQDIEAQHGKIETDSITALNAYTGTTRQDDDLTMVHHYYHKPTHWCDEGMYVCYVGKKILKASTFPYKSGRLPIEHLPFDKPPMRFWALSTIDQIIDLQEQLNRAASMIVEARNLIARPRVLASEEAKVPGQQLSDIPGAIIRFKQAGGVPKFEVPSFNFTELANHKADVRAALQQVSGISGASRGEIPAATKTALALQLVLEQDRSQWAPFIKQFYQVIKMSNLGILEIAAEYFPAEDPRVIKIEQNNIVGMKEFHGGLVPSPLDIELEDTNPLGWTAGARIEAVQGLYEKGIITDANQVLEMLHLKNDNAAYAFEHINRQTARKENEMLNRGEVVSVESEDFDPIHLDEHVKEMVAFNFKLKPALVKKAFEDHVALHKERAARAQPQPPPGKPTAAGGEALAGVAANLSPPPTGPERMNELITSARSG
jgi:hypothetical protein